MKKYCLVSFSLFLSTILNAALFPMTLMEQPVHKLELHHVGGMFVGAEVKKIEGELVTAFYDCKPSEDPLDEIAFICTNGEQILNIFRDDEFHTVLWTKGTESEFFISDSEEEFEVLYQVAPYTLVVSSSQMDGASNYSVSIIAVDEFLNSEFGQCVGGFKENDDKSLEFNLACENEKKESVTLQGYARAGEMSMDISARWVTTNMYDPDDIFAGTIDISELAR